MLGLGKKKPQQAQLMVKGDISPEEKQALKELYWNSSEAYSRTFLPLVLVNRQKVIYHLGQAKKSIDKLIPVL